MNSWLVGIAKCAHCGYALSLNYGWNVSRTKQWRYFIDSGAYHANGCIKKRLDIKPDVAEHAVFEAMKERIKTLEIAKKKRSKPNAETDKINAEILRLDDEIRKLMDKLSEADEVLFDYIQKRIKELHNRKSEFEKKLRQRERKHKEIDTSPLADPLSRWDELTVQEKHDVAVTMIDVVKISDETGIDIRFSI